MLRKLLLFVLIGFAVSAQIWAEETSAIAPTAGNGTESSPYEIATLANLRWLSETSDVWGSYFIQTTDIDASETADWNSEEGFSPIGNKTTYFTGNYNGQGHIISELTISRSSDKYVALFGYAYGDSIENLGLTDCSITGYNYVGGIVGYNAQTLTSCYVTGEVTGNEYVGGLVGYNSINSSIVDNSYVEGTITGLYMVGGLVGINNSAISNCYVTESVSGTTFVGRLVGMNYSTLSNCFYETQVLDLTSAIGYDNNDQTATELSSIEMQTLSSFTDWDFAAITTDGTDDAWAISTGTNDGYPVLLWQLDLNTPVLGKLSATLDGTAVDLSCSFSSLGIPNPVSYGFYYSTIASFSDANLEDLSVMDLGVVNGYDDAIGATEDFSGTISDITNEPTLYIVAYAINAADTVYSDVATININDAPEITSTALLSATEDEEYSYQVEAIDVDGDELTYSINNAPEGMEISADGLISWTPGEGVTTSGEITVTVSDGELTDNQSFTIAVTAVNDAPEITSTAVTSATEDEEYSYQVEADDAEGDELTYSLSNAPEGMEISAVGLITWTPGEGVTTSGEITVTVSDGDLTDTQTFTIAVTAVNDAPEITSTAIISATEDSEYSYQVEATDVDGDELTYSLSNAPDGMEISADGLITWTPGGEVTTSGEITVTVSDGELTDTQSFTITVTAVNDAPEITSTAMLIATEEEEYSYQVVAVDEEGDELTYSLSDAPDGMEISADGLITWTPGEGVTTSGEIIVIVSDGELTDTQNFNIAVTAVNDAPEIKSSAITSATEDIEYSYQVEAVDPEGDELTYSLTTSPDGMEMSSEGLISWTPGEGVVSAEVTVVVSDGDLSDKQSFTISVIAVNDAPEITSSAITSATEDSEYSYQVEAEDPDSDALTYSLSSAPDGMEISETGLITWTPAERVFTSGEVVVVVSDGELYDTQSFTISVDEDIDSFNIYPNPATTTLYVDGAKGVVSFYNLAGKKVYSFDLAQNYIIDISSLASGIYLVKVDGHVVKVVKQ